VNVVPGDFSILGFTRRPREQVLNAFSDRLGITPRLIEFGSEGSLYFHSTYADIAESETAVLIKWGFARSQGYSALSAQEMLKQKLIGPASVETSELHGDALFAYISKTEPAFLVYKTLLAIPQLYYSASEGEIVCADRLNPITRAMRRVELNESALPMHFLFRSALGAETYFRGVKRLLWGQLLRWKQGTPHVELLRGMRFDDEDSIRRMDQHSLEMFYDVLDAVISDDCRQANRTSNRVGNLLSGGVDSSLIQHVLSRHPDEATNRSFSFTTQAPSFQFESDYARQASEHFHTDHAFVPFTEHDYPRLLEETIDSLAFPPFLPSEPAIYAVAKYCGEMDRPLRFFMSGQAAEGSFGFDQAWKIKLGEKLHRFPGATRLILGVSRVLEFLPRHGKRLRRQAEKLRMLYCYDCFESEMNAVDVMGDLDRLVRCFGEQQIGEALEFRRNVAAPYKTTESMLERVFLIDLLTDSYDVAAERNQLFLSNCSEIIHPYLDEDVLRAAFRFHPDIRYDYRGKDKYVLKELLHKKTGLPTAWKAKGGAQFFAEFYTWMRTGSLRPLVDAIDLPGFISRQDFEKLAQNPDIFLWGLLTLDLFKKRVLGAEQRRAETPALV
jgi:asparagine synthetase B (glutamine-hydrolysing)